MFSAARFPTNSLASFFGETVAFRRRPPPPRGRSRRSLHRSVLMFLNPSPFGCFSFVFIFRRARPWPVLCSSSSAIPQRPPAPEPAVTVDPRAPVAVRVASPAPRPSTPCTAARRRRPVRAWPCGPPLATVTPRAGTARCRRGPQHRCCAVGRPRLSPLPRVGSLPLAAAGNPTVARTTYVLHVNEPR